jgi:hypothetical protein
VAFNSEKDHVRAGDGLVDILRGEKAVGGSAVAHFRGIVAHADIFAGRRARPDQAFRQGAAEIAETDDADFHKNPPLRRYELKKNHAHSGNCEHSSVIIYTARVTLPLRRHRVHT